MLIGLQLVAYFAINPFLISLTDWRNIVTEEADALMHASVVKVPPGVSEQLGTPGKRPAHWELEPAASKASNSLRLTIQALQCADYDAPQVRGDRSGQSAPLAGPQFTPCASSGRAW